MILTEEQYNKLPTELQKHFSSMGGDDGVSRNTHPT